MLLTIQPAAHLSCEALSFLSSVFFREIKLINWSAWCCGLVVLPWFLAAHLA